MNLDKAIEALAQAQDVAKHGGNNDMLAFVPDILSALEYTIAELIQLKTMPLDEICLWQARIKKEN